MEYVLIHYFLFVSLLFIVVDKLKIEEKLASSKIKIFFKLGSCDFCLSFWVSVISVILLNSMVFNFTKLDLFMPFVITGLHLTINKIFENE